MNVLRRIEEGLVTAERAALIALIVVMVVLSFLQVVLRGLFSGGVLWADTFLRHLVLWVAFFGAGLAAARDKQFAMDAAQRLFSGRVRAGVHLVIHTFTAAVCAVLASASWTFVRGEYEAEIVLFSVGRTDIPAWTFESILPAGFVLLAFHYALKTAIAALELKSGDAPVPHAMEPLDPGNAP